MINFDGEELKDEFNQVFGFNISVRDGLKIENLTPKQLWWLTKFVKHVRGRCRNNSAFNNYMNRNFSPARFREVPKEYQGKKYMGLSIEVDGQISEQEEGD